MNRLDVIDTATISTSGEARTEEVPEVLRSGDHGRIASWRHAQALHRTAALRPDLIAARGGMTADEEALMALHPPVDGLAGPA